ncbi:MAG: uridine kinase [Bdellovibrionales bacterium]|nr:uridine kinase [Bdellovibrionales bacterium]
MRVTGSIKRNRPYILGVAGGSGSGKTYFASAVQRALGESVCAIVYQDSFYIDQSAKFDFDGGAVNFDHPDSLDFALLVKCLSKIKNAEEAELPIYDFHSHSRSAKTLRLPVKPVILVDGTLIFHPPEVRALFDDLIFFDTPEALRFQRRLERDVKERGRTAEGVRKQFESQVKPMHDKFVEPSKRFANTTVVDVGQFDDVLARYTKALRDLI